MGFFDFLKPPGIDQGIQEYESTPEAILLDVRTPQEYKEGHIPGSKNIPLQQITQTDSISDRKDLPVFVYCHSGSRSGQAAGILKKMGYTNVKNIGGIASYTGKVVR